MRFFIATAFALSYDSPRDCAVKGVLNDLNGVVLKWYLPL